MTLQINKLGLINIKKIKILLCIYLNSKFYVCTNNKKITVFNKS
jgi:hypothetical protein